MIIETVRRIEQVRQRPGCAGAAKSSDLAPELDPAALPAPGRALPAVRHRQPPDCHREAGPSAVTVCLGWASFPLHPDLAPQLGQAVNWVDMALYKAKADGRYRAVGIITARPGTVLGEANEDFEGPPFANAATSRCASASVSTRRGKSAAPLGHLPARVGPAQTLRGCVAWVC